MSVEYKFNKYTCDNDYIKLVDGWCGSKTTHHVSKHLIYSISFVRKFDYSTVFLSIFLITTSFLIHDEGVKDIFQLNGLVLGIYQIYRFLVRVIVINAGNMSFVGFMTVEQADEICNWYHGRPDSQRMRMLNDV